MIYLYLAILLAQQNCICKYKIYLISSPSLKMVLLSFFSFSSFNSKRLSGKSLFPFESESQLFQLNTCRQVDQISRCMRWSRMVCKMQKKLKVIYNNNPEQQSSYQLTTEIVSKVLIFFTATGTVCISTPLAPFTEHTDQEYTDTSYSYYYYCCYTTNSSSITPAVQRSSLSFDWQCNSIFMILYRESVKVQYQKTKGQFLLI